MILIYPPVAKISEPPLGVAILAGALKEQQINCKVIDANVEGMMWLAKWSGCDTTQNFIGDRWTKRAVIHLDRNISELKNITLYKNMARYRQRVMDLNRVITTSLDRKATITPFDKQKQISSSLNGRFKISLSDYTDATLTPVKSQDLLTSARQYSKNPFYPFFETHLAHKIETHLGSEIEENFVSAIEKNSFEYIGISVCYLSQALTAFALVGWIKTRFPEKKIVMGGGVITSWMSMPTWNDPFKGLIDFMVKGRGEETLINLCQKNFDEKNLDGKTLDRKNLDEKTLDRKNYRPNFDFCKWDHYIAPVRIIPFRTSTGCYWNKCRFCPEKAEGNPYKPENNTELLDDLQYLVEQNFYRLEQNRYPLEQNRYRLEQNRYPLEDHSQSYVHFTDDAISPSFLKALVSKMTRGIPENINNSESYLFKWYGFVRFTKELADPQFCHALYRSGCRLLKLGLESGEQAVLDKMEKGTDLTLASKVLTCLQNAGIKTYIYLLFGTQFEDEYSANKTFEYVLCHSDRISFLNLAIFNLPRFSEDANHLQTEMFSEGDLSLYLNFKHPMGWDRKKVRLFLDNKFRKNPTIGQILKNDPPFFTSNHAIFKNI